jgi:hypothetical protein
MKDIKKFTLGPNDFYCHLGLLSCLLTSMAVVAVDGGGEAGRQGGREAMSTTVVVVVVVVSE